MITRVTIYVDQTNNMGDTSGSRSETVVTIRSQPKKKPQERNALGLTVASLLKEAIVDEGGSWNEITIRQQGTEPGM